MLWIGDEIMHPDGTSCPAGDEELKDRWKQEDSGSRVTGLMLSPPVRLRSRLLRAVFVWEDRLSHRCFPSILSHDRAV